MLVKDITRNLTLSVGLVKDCCAGPFSVAKLCMLLLQHKLSVGCGLDSNYVGPSLPNLALIIARQVLDK